MRRLGVVVLIALSACTGSTTPPTPAVVTRYLQALHDGDARAAYDLTQLDELADSPGSAVTFAHFAAFLRAHPVDAYTVTKVHEFKISNAPGQASYEVTVRVNGARTEVLDVDPGIVATVTVEPVVLEIHAAGGLRAFSIDGVAVEPQRQPGLYRIIVLPGPHLLRAGGRAVSFTTSPLAVVSGPARAEGVEPNSYLVLR